MDFRLAKGVPVGTDDLGNVPNRPSADGCGLKNGLLMPRAGSVGGRLASPNSPPRVDFCGNDRLARVNAFGCGGVENNAARIVGFGVGGFNSPCADSAFNSSSRYTQHGFLS